MLTVVVVLYYPYLWLCEVSYALCLLPSSCSVVCWWSCNSWCFGVLLVLRYFLQLSLSSGILRIEALLVQRFEVLQSLLSGVFCIVPWDSLSGLCASWDSLSSCPSLWLDRCTLGWPVWPVVGYPLLGVHPSITIVKLIVFGYCCNCLDGQLNYWASTHWLISVTIMFWIHDWWLCHSTLLQWL